MLEFILFYLYKYLKIVMFSSDNAEVVGYNVTFSS